MIEMISRVKERKRRDKLIVEGQKMTTVTIVWEISVKNVQLLDSIVQAHPLTPVNVQTQKIEVAIAEDVGRVAAKTRGIVSTTDDHVHQAHVGDCPTLVGGPEQDRDHGLPLRDRKESGLVIKTVLAVIQVVRIRMVS